MTTFYWPTFRRGKSKRAKEYKGSVPAVTTVAINRYNTGMTVGHGHYKVYAYTDPAGAPCAVLGWFNDGRVSVNLPRGGCGVLGRADVEVTSWPDYVPADRRAEWEALPRISRVAGQEILLEQHGRLVPLGEGATR